ncbi:hypothetical protein N7497_000987 [Penicillium chrysogenum]|nr:hypothetical protein N7497_000987 [Penicillium chrysogenum]
MAITGYFIDKDWNYREILLGFQPLQGAHSGANLSAVLLKIFQQHQIVDRVLAVTTDNASNNNTLITSIQESIQALELDEQITIIRIPCIAHVIQLSLNKLLSRIKANPKNQVVEREWSESRSQALRSSQRNKEIANTLENFRGLAVFINGSPQRRDAFLSLQTEEPKLVPIQDTVTTFFTARPFTTTLTTTLINTHQHTSTLTINTHHQHSPSTLTINTHHQHSPSTLTINTHHQHSPSTLTINTHHQHSPSTLTINTHHQHSPSTLTINTHHQHSPSTLTINTHHQHSPSTLTINTHHQHSPSTLTINTHHQHSPSTLTINTHHQHSPSTLTINTHHQHSPSTLTINTHINTNGSTQQAFLDNTHLCLPNPNERCQFLL